MRDTLRSGCPISLSLEVFGDRWSLLIVRDIMFAGKRHFREFLASEERISSRILTDRLNALKEAGILTKADDPSHKQKGIYSLTEKAIDLLPILVQIGVWGTEHQPATKPNPSNAIRLKRGGPLLWKSLMSDLRRVHLA